ncbi:uncharacterized protein PHACADRAFT_195239 [Phanerochaete carnosa HHB-10118-sp]|uniref:Uncharacterized protein n=1 Tax=Phanerochaete carnosa (strain HHB-10118-sp) TaxID=650164 RepID=K5W8A6_PHACS|nr:uncharacterized protein PHACADRAFT_195239 [Phanerochaete carnosa HHB-10118-sp]EKM55214.1 hypothetical protein PHACADRAFT_195239 [Phanerochaete carnosa HHB-10118-sp]
MDFTFTSQSHAVTGEWDAAEETKATFEVTKEYECNPEYFVARACGLDGRPADNFWLSALTSVITFNLQYRTAELVDRFISMVVDGYHCGPVNPLPVEAQMRMDKMQPCIRKKT